MAASKKTARERGKATTRTTRRSLYPALRTNRSGYLKVSALHEIY